MPRALDESELHRAAVIGADWVGDMIFQETGSEGLGTAYFDIMLHADSLVGPSAILEGQPLESQENCQAETTQHHSTGSEYCGMENMFDLILQTPSQGTVVEGAVSENDLSSLPVSKATNLHHCVWPSEEDVLPRQSQSSIASSCIQTLSKLAVDLHAHRMTVPPQSIHNRGSALDESPLKIHFSIDNTFCLTQSLIDIYPTCIDTFVTGTANLSSGTPSEQSFDISRENLTSTFVPHVARIDQPSILLILSCHMRLIEIYQELFAHAHACIDQEGTTHNHKQTNPSVPALRIGSYVPSPSMAASMQMMLGMHLSTQLLDYATQLFAAIQPSRHAGDNAGLMTSGTEMSLGTAENVKKGAHNMVTQFSKLQGTMRELKILA
jgi:hypothetical protein